MVRVNIRHRLSINMSVRLHIILRIWVVTKGVYTAILFKILNDVTTCIMLDSENIILTVKLTNWKRLEIERILFASNLSCTNVGQHFIIC